MSVCISAVADAACRLPLETMKCKIAKNLEELERLGVVSSTDSYQYVIKSIAQV